MGVEVVSVEQAGSVLGCSRSRVFELLRDGVLERAPRFGRSLRIYGASVDRALLGVCDAPTRKRRTKAPPVVRLSDIPSQR